MLFLSEQMKSVPALGRKEVENSQLCRSTKSSDQVPSRETTPYRLYVLGVAMCDYVQCGLVGP